VVIIKVQKEDFDVADLHRQLRLKSTNPGALASFTGLVREFYASEQAERGNAVTGLELEHYPGMTEAALQRIVEEATDRWDVQSAAVVHRIGYLQAGDQIVHVAVTSAHRGDAFEAAAFIMDYLKTEAPFWKKQHRQQGAEWISRRDSDLAAAERWREES